MNMIYQMNGFYSRNQVQFELNIDKVRLPYLAQSINSAHIEQVMF
ncbi:hypothetical protein ACFFWB_23135 [Flavobacterium procerum]